MGLFVLTALSSHGISMGDRDPESGACAAAIRAEVNELADMLFEACDLNQTGIVTKGELDAVFGTYNLGTRTSEMLYSDEDLDRKLTKAEFTAAINTNFDDIPQESARLATQDRLFFRDLGPSKGLVTAESMTAALTDILTQKSVEDAGTKAASMVEGADRNRSGKISFKEFKSIADQLRTFGAL